MKIITRKSSCGKFQFTLKDTFIQKHGDIIESEDLYVLMTNYKLSSYLHNENGPAIVYLQVDQPPSFWLNGKEVTEDDLPRLKHNKDFAKAVDEILDI